MRLGLDSTAPHPTPPPLGEDPVRGSSGLGVGGQLSVAWISASDNANGLNGLLDVLRPCLSRSGNAPLGPLTVVRSHADQVIGAYIVNDGCLVSGSLGMEDLQGEQTSTPLKLWISFGAKHLQVDAGKHCVLIHWNTHFNPRSKSMAPMCTGCIIRIKGMSYAGRLSNQFWCTWYTFYIHIFIFLWWVCVVGRAVVPTIRTWGLRVS